MKRQLRPGDLLARLGGDEFARPDPSFAAASEVEEIASAAGTLFRRAVCLWRGTSAGSASVGIALYPEDATTRDSLLSAADAAMYAREEYGSSNDSPWRGSRSSQITR